MIKYERKIFTRLFRSKVCWLPPKALLSILSLEPNGYAEHHHYEVPSTSAQRSNEEGSNKNDGYETIANDLKTMTGYGE